ncbi:MAG: polysaccharide biosynthesis protein [Methyloligellaceae bacterium]
MSNLRFAHVGWCHWFVNLPRWQKRTVLVLNDLFLFSLALWVSFTLRLSALYLPPSLEFGLLLAAAPPIGVATFYFSGLYRLVTRYIGYQGTLRIFIAVLLTVLIWAVLVLMSGIIGVPRSVIVSFGVFAAFFIWLSRQLAGWLLKGVPNIKLARFGPERDNVIIYGAGATGVQLLEALKQADDYKAVGFVDDSESLWGQRINGLKVYRPSKIQALITDRSVKQIFLAIPDQSARDRRTIIQDLEPHAVAVKILPGMNDIASGRVQVTDLRAVDVHDLLGRDPIPPDPALLQQNIRGKSVMVTGAGGSIGSELCRQIMQLSPRKLVLYDVSEAALYDIDLELTELLQRLPERPDRQGGRISHTDLVPIIGSVLDSKLLGATIGNYRVDTIYHAAAYKHVPLVEQNPIAGLINNTFGTSAVAKAAKEHGVERFVLVSTDKAVRPTNVMGASKRLAELIVQAEAQSRPKTVYSIVRFGNVLDSSGSVVRRFRNQIERGGPVTVTHPDINRYFMSISEAAELVIQAGSMATGGDVFVLDMGQPVKIDDLARSMIRLMGLEVQDDVNANGDIQIEYVGLRYGEKLYEELLIGGDTKTTEHMRIKKHAEPIYPAAILEIELAKLKDAINQNHLKAITNILTRTVEGYVPDKWMLQQQRSASDERWTPVSQTLH